jgi:hypothetical protein
MFVVPQRAAALRPQRAGKQRFCAQRAAALQAEAEARAPGATGAGAAAAAAAAARLAATEEEFERTPLDESPDSLDYVDFVEVSIALLAY